MTGSLERSSGLAGADLGLGLRPKNIGARVKRVEDRRLLTGTGRFCDDERTKGEAYAVFVRSPHACADTPSRCRAAHG